MSQDTFTETHLSRAQNKRRKRRKLITAAAVLTSSLALAVGLAVCLNGGLSSSGITSVRGQSSSTAPQPPVTASAVSPP